MRSILLCLSEQWIQVLPCQRDPRSKNGREVREGRETELGLIDNVWQKDRAVPQRGQGM